MKKVFVDTNIIVDLIADRKPFSKYAIEIFNKAEVEEVKLFTSSHSIATTHYLLKKFLEEKKIREILSNLLDYLTVIPVDVDVLKKGLRSKYKDFEDAIQMIAALQNKVDCLVTRNVKDYHPPLVKVLQPVEFLTTIEGENNP